MSIHLDSVSWYVDENARSNGEPGIYHSFMASLATAVHHLDPRMDPAWLMGASGFAFRIFVNETLCPSAMSIFNWSDVLPQAVEQAGFQCTYVSRMWHEGAVETQRRQEAHHAVVEALQRGRPAVVWDVADCEWGLIVGYDARKRSYHTLTHRGAASLLPAEKLGKNGIDILSVAIAEQPNKRTRSEIIAHSLKAAVTHAEQGEWTDRPKYQNGLAAYDLWASALDTWAASAEAGRGGTLSEDGRFHATYYAGHYYSARRYAEAYVRAIAGESEPLHSASRLYGQTASLLKPVWDCFSGKDALDHDRLRFLAQSLRSAKTAEQEAIRNIKMYLAESEP